MEEIQASLKVRMKCNMNLTIANVFVFMNTTYNVLSEPEVFISDSQ